MPSPLLSAADYPEVRAAVDVALSDKRAPDAVLGLSIYVPAGCADVLTRDPLAEARTGPAAEAIHRAAVYFSAARLALGLREISSETFGDVRVDLDTVAAGERAAALTELGQQAVADAIALDGEVVASTGPGFAAFGLARAGRRWGPRW